MKDNQQWNQRRGEKRKIWNRIYHKALSHKLYINNTWTTNRNFYHQKKTWRWRTSRISTRWSSKHSSKVTKNQNNQRHPKKSYWIHSKRSRTVAKVKSIWTTRFSQKMNSKITFATSWMSNRVPNSKIRVLDVNLLWLRIKTGRIRVSHPKIHLLAFSRIKGRICITHIVLVQA